MCKDIFPFFLKVLIQKMLLKFYRRFTDFNKEKSTNLRYCFAVILITRIYLGKCLVRTT